MQQTISQSSFSFRKSPTFIIAQLSFAINLHQYHIDYHLVTSEKYMIFRKSPQDYISLHKFAKTFFCYHLDYVMYSILYYIIWRLIVSSFFRKCSGLLNLSIKIWAGLPSPFRKQFTLHLKLKITTAILSIIQNTYSIPSFLTNPLNVHLSSRSVDCDNH